VLLTLEHVRRPQPLDFNVDGQFAFRFGNMCDYDLADQSEISSEREMPRCSFVSDYVAEMIIENIDNLVVGDIGFT
jgi:hypothetical protein